MMLERGVVVSYETIRRWCTKFGQAYAKELREWLRTLRCNEILLRPSTQI